MPEPPDFDQIARQCLGVDHAPITIPANTLQAGQTVRLTAQVIDDPIIAAVAERLRLVWNARGAADVALILKRLTNQLGVKDLDRALRTLDR